jgi:hypothetical protein
MMGLKRARLEEPPPFAAAPQVLEQLPPDFWTFAHGIGAFSIEEWARLALCGLSLPAGVSFDDEDEVCMACGRTDQTMAYDEWLRSERYVTRCLCQACFGKLHGPMVSCTDWLPHIRLAYPEEMQREKHAFLCRDPMRNTKAAIGRFVESIVRAELLGNGYCYRAQHAQELERVIRRTAELLREVLPQIAPFGREQLCKAIGTIAVAVTGLGI